MNSSPIELPSDVEARSIARFDVLLLTDEIKYESSVPELVTDEGHEVQFRIIPSLSRKPQLPPSSLAHTVPLYAPQPPRPFNPFLPPDLDERAVICPVGNHHLLLLNKFCVTRPMMLLTTKEFRLQSEDLNMEDWAACAAMLSAFGKGYIAIFNCGQYSGNSQRHKHMQCFQKESPEDYVLFPDRKDREHEYVAPDVFSVASVPYKHFISKLSALTPATLSEAYTRLLLLTKEAVRHVKGAPSYNVVLVHDWMMLVPRSHAGRDAVNANAAGMAGTIWLARDEERKKWSEFGIAKHLAYLGIER